MNLLYLLLLICGAATSTPSLPLDWDDSSLTSIKYYLYTRSHRRRPEELFTGNEASVENSAFDGKIPTKLIIHGWSKSAAKIPNPEIRSAYLDTGIYNVIVVDWSKLANLTYASSRALVPKVGENVAMFIDFLTEKTELRFPNLVVIGHSLGAHVAGFAGRYLTRGALRYIVALDPAKPLFSYDKPDERLNTGDAFYVMTIQTNGAYKGFADPIGTASFFPNRGLKQPGCGLDLDGTCSHARGVYYYAEAIRGKLFTPIYRCTSYDDVQDKTGCSELVPYLNIGDPTNMLREKGIFYFETNSKAPFGHYDENI